MLGKLGLTTDVAIVIICCTLLVLLILYVVILTSHLKLKHKYSDFMKGSNGKTLENTILSRLKDIDTLKSDSSELKGSVETILKKITYTYQKVALVKYDAFKEMGGKLSFSLCMLDGNNDGFILTSMHSSREGSYTYIKEIIKGESFVLLAEEEKNTLDEAKGKAQ